MTREERLVRGQERGYLIAPPRYHDCVAYRVWCLRQQRPYVHVYVHRRSARGRLDFDTTRNRSDETRACLSEQGAEMIRTFCGRAAPHARLLGVSAGSTLAVISQVPCDNADALGEVLYAAAMAATPSAEGTGS
jgi:hypothetical protein